MSETNTLPQAVMEEPWPEVVLPPSDLPYDDGERMESPWHNSTATMLVAGYLASRGGSAPDVYAGINMFLYYSAEQARNRDYKGPDVFFAKGVDAARERNYWAIWDEGGRYPNVIIELLSPSTETIDLGSKKQLYEQVFRTPEYFCIAPQLERLLGWRLIEGRYEPIVPDEHGRLWCAELELAIGPWHGVFLAREATYARFYYPDGRLVRQRAEQERERAEQERQRADELAARVAALEAELRALREEQK